MGLDLSYDEGQTPLDEDEKEGLKIESISTQKELDEFEQLNIEKAIIWTLSNRFSTDRILTEKFIKELHIQMFGEVWKWAGDFRKSDKNIGVEWSRISVELKTLIDDTTYWIKHQTFESNEIAIRFKHRLVAIHCFSNGNGRHSRLMADILMESCFGGEVFSWNKSSLVKSNQTRKAYIEALKKADKGDINPLIEFAES